MATANYASNIYTGGNANDPISVWSLMNPEGDETAFASSSNGAIAVQTSKKGTPQEINGYLDLTDQTIVMSRQDYDSRSLISFASGATLRIQEGVGNIFRDNDRTNGGASWEIFKAGTEINVAEGARLRIGIPLTNDPTDNLNEPQASNRTLLVNSNTDSRIRMDIDMGPYIFGQTGWFDKTTKNTDSNPIFNSGNIVNAVRTSSSIINYNISPNVPVRDILFRGAYVDFRPSLGAGFPNAGGFVADYGMRWLSSQDPLATHVDTSPIIVGSPDEEFNIDFDTFTVDSGTNEGIWLFGMRAGVGGDYRIAINNFNGLNWFDRMAVFSGREEHGVFGNSILENHVYPTAKTINAGFENLEGAEVSYRYMQPSYGVSGTDPAIIYNTPALYLGVTDGSGEVTLGNQTAAAPRSADQGVIVTQATYKIGNDDTENYFFLNSDDDNIVAYAENVTHAYDLHRLGNKILFNQLTTSFTTPPAISGGKPDIGTLNLAEEADLSDKVTESKPKITIANQAALLINDATANAARVFFNGTEYTVTNVAGSSVAISDSDFAVDDVVTILSYHKRVDTEITTIDRLFDRLYYDVINEAKSTSSLPRDYDAQRSEDADAVDYLDFGTTDVTFIENETTFNRTITSEGLILNVIDGCPDAGDTFIGIQNTGDIEFDGTITCGVNTTGSISFDTTPTELFNTTEKIVSGTTGLTLTAGSYSVVGADMTDLFIIGPGGTDIAEIALSEGAIAPPAANITGNVTFPVALSVTISTGETLYEASKAATSFFRSSDGMTFTEVTATLTPPTDGNGTYTVNGNDGDQLYYAVAYDGYEITSDHTAEDTDTLTALPPLSIDFGITLSAAENTLITNTTATATATGVRYLVPNVGIGVLDNKNARLVMRRFAEKDAALQQMARGVIQSDFIGFTVIGVALDSPDDITFLKDTGDAIVRIDVETLDKAGNDQSANITSNVSSTEVRFKAKSTSIFTDQQTFDLVTEKFLEDAGNLNDQLQGNIYSAFKTEL